MSVPKNQQQMLDFVAEGEIEDGILVMPTLYSLDSRGKVLLWTIHIGAFTASDEIIPIDDDLLDRGDLPDNAYAAYWTISGRENMTLTTSERTIIYSGKNKGRANFTTALTQCILDARSLYEKKIRKGCKANRHALKGPDDIYTFEELAEDESRGEHPWRVFAMALHDFKKFPNKIHYPACIQRKLDGILLIVVHHPALPTISVEMDDEGNTQRLKIDAYSRSRETYEGQDHILRELYPIAERYPGLHFVGELWKEGHGLQDISGSARRKADTKLKTEKLVLNFNIFDCFHIDEPKSGFAERQATLDDVFLEIDSLTPKPKYITRVPTEEIPNDKELKKIYNVYLREGYEGAVVRNLTAPYEFGINKELRSYQTMKLKPRPDAEWQVVGFEEGKGKETGAVKWICAENDTGVQARTGKILPLEERKTFRVTPNQPTEVRKHIFAKYSDSPELFKEQVYGKELVVGYSILSKDYLPQQPKGLRFRDPAVDKIVRS
jgi:hypothetical protein